MVLLSKIFQASKPKKVFRKYMQNGFLDSLRIYVRGGSGGNGLPKFGGIGGQGGSISVVAKEDISLENVIKEHPTKRISAKHGKDSSHNFILGPPGDNIKVDVPLGVTVFTDEGMKIGELNNEGEEIIVAIGGTGGHPKNGFLGSKGQARSIKLDLKLIADIGLVGFPNAGKSTLLKAVSHAKPKIANYPFTTIKPNIGIMIYKDLRQISMADLPGLIEGAHMNKGMGHKFLKHVERTKLLLLVVDINGFQLSPLHKYRTCLDTIILLNKELEMYNPDLLKKPASIIINKMDTEGATEKLKEIKDKILNLSETVKEFPEEFRPETALHFDEIVAISAKQGGEQIDLVKQKLRKLLDIHASINIDEVIDSNAKIMNQIKEDLQEKRRRLV